MSKSNSLVTSLQQTIAGDITLICYKSMTQQDHIGIKVKIEATEYKQ
jgi:hypothetical protein